MESQVATIKVVTIIAIAVTIPSITLRWVARYQSAQLGWDDYTALVAAICLIILATISLACQWCHFCLPFLCSICTDNCPRRIPGFWLARVAG